MLNHARYIGNPEMVVVEKAELLFSLPYERFSF